MSSENSLWVFGYGSLCWLQGFDYGSQQLGYIQGFSRKFWQGNNSHRGTQDKPGRVATLVEEEEAVTWGLAFELVGDAALNYLNERECTKGGYETFISTFFSRDGVKPPFPVLVYRATKHNSQWLGPAPLTDVAAQVAECKGEAGHNIEYVLRLAEFLREQLPEVRDDHLFTLELLVREKMKEKDVNFTEESTVLTKESAVSPSRAAPTEEVRRDSFQHQSRVTPKKLLCLKV